ncbi:AraC family transcriptional regulator [Paenibacillus qinlingensis]|uniref:AraC family transcriptional regulator n=1 Tax=Paenibacillus qinlingensis TaxID=1837343 RepID=UPI00156570D8|nr:helix-turn-helix domain-containing protein [Paenibacillus qinlingensis]NQX62695.1 helix-turn-helix domain-containing protein [Paenibacillus qinlingensis]
MKKITEARTSKKLYANIFLSLIICIIVTIVTLSFALYANFEKIALSNIYASEKSSLSQSSYSAKSMIESSTNYAIQIYADPQFDKLLHYTAPNTLDTTNALSRLSTYMNVSYFFHSIYIYSKNSKTVYTTSQSSMNAIQSIDHFSDPEAVNFIENFSLYKRLAPIPRTIQIETPFLGVEKTANVYTFVFYDLQGPAKDLDNVIMLNVSERWMKEAIMSLDTDKTGSTFIIDSHGKAVTSTETMPFLSDLNDRSYIQKVLTASTKQSSDYFVGDVEGKKSLVVFSKHDQSGWTFIRVLPYDTIMGKIEVMKKNVLVVCSILLLVGLTVSYVISKSLHKPIDKVISNINFLTNEKRNNQFKLKQEFLRRLIWDSSSKRVTDIETKLKEFDIRVDPYRDFMVILLTIDHFDQFSKQYNFEDRSLLKYATMNIATEIFGSYGKCECIDMDEKNVAVLLNGDFEENLPLRELALRVQESIQAYLNLSMSIAISEVGDNVFEISDLYKETVQLLDNKFVFGYRSILQASHVPQLSQLAFVHPVALENNMLETLKLGKADETRKWFNDILTATDYQSYIVYTMLFHQLAYSISTTAINLEKSSGLSFNYDFTNFVQQLHKLETLQDVRNHFNELIECICAGLKDRKGSKHDNLVASVDKIIQQHYADRELSLFKIAELIDMSPAYLGRIFKKLTAQSIPDYLNEYRIDRAKEFLSTTHDSIEEISQKTGYNNSTYFYKVFKKYTGITPAEYRNGT